MMPFDLLDEVLKASGLSKSADRSVYQEKLDLLSSRFCGRVKTPQEDGQKAAALF